MKHPPCVTPEMLAVKTRKPSGGGLSEAQVVRVLLGKESILRLAAEFQQTKQALYEIRKGRSYRSIRPDLPRKEIRKVKIRVLEKA